MATDANQSRGIDERLRPFLDALAAMLAESIIRKNRSAKSTSRNIHASPSDQHQRPLTNARAEPQVCCSAHGDAFTSSSEDRPGFPGNSSSVQGGAR